MMFAQNLGLFMWFPALECGRCSLYVLRLVFTVDRTRPRTRCRKTQIKGTNISLSYQHADSPLTFV